jgi:hypothetical protein
MLATLDPGCRTSAGWLAQMLVNGDSAARYTAIPDHDAAAASDPMPPPTRAMRST